MAALRVAIERNDLAAAAGRLLADRQRL